MEFIYSDGGRGRAGYKGECDDCVCRAVAITADLSYETVYRALAQGNATQRQTSKTGKRPKTARNGIITKRKWFKDYMRELGFVWTPLMTVGSGCTTHLRASELPSEGRFVLSLAKHYTSLIDGVLHDTFDPTYGRNDKCVYGYWQIEN